MPAPIIYGACGACGHLKMGRACLRPIIYGACGACGEEEGACAPLFTMPAVPAAKRRVPAPHYLQCLRCLQRRVGCQRPIIYNACGACGEKEGACAPFFTMPAVPAAKRRVPAPHHLPCLRRLRRQRGCLRSSIHNVSPSRSDDGNDDDDVLVAGLLMMIACGDGDGGVSHPFLWSGSDMYERTQHFLMLTPFSRRARGRSLRQRSGCRRGAQASGPW